MKKYICEVAGCNKTATVKLKNNHRICEDCAKELRRSKSKVIWKQELVGHLGERCNIYIDYPVKVK